MRVSLMLAALTLALWLPSGADAQNDPNDMSTALGLITVQGPLNTTKVSHAFYIGDTLWATTLHTVAGTPSGKTVKLRIAAWPDNPTDCEVLAIEPFHDLAVMTCTPLIGRTPTLEFHPQDRQWESSDSPFDLYGIFAIESREEFEKTGAGQPLLKKTVFTVGNDGIFIPTAVPSGRYYGCTVKVAFEQLSKAPESGYSGAPLVKIPPVEILRHPPKHKRRSGRIQRRLVNAVWSHRHKEKRVGLLVKAGVIEVMRKTIMDKGIDRLDRPVVTAQAFVTDCSNPDEMLATSINHDEGADHCQKALSSADFDQLTTACPGLTEADVKTYREARLLEHEVYRGQGGAAALVAMFDSGLGGAEGLKQTVRPDRAELLRMVAGYRMAASVASTQAVHPSATAAFYQHRFEERLLSVAAIGVLGEAELARRSGWPSPALTIVDSLACGSGGTGARCLERTNIGLLARTMSQQPIRATPDAALCYLENSARALNWQKAGGFATNRVCAMNWSTVVEQAVEAARAANCSWTSKPTDQLTWADLIASARFQVGLWLGYEHAGVFRIDDIYETEFGVGPGGARALLDELTRLVTAMRTAVHGTRAAVDPDMQFGLSRLEALFGAEGESIDSISALLRRNICIFPPSQRPSGLGTQLYYALDATAAGMCSTLGIVEVKVEKLTGRRPVRRALCDVFSRSDDHKRPVHANGDGVHFERRDVHRSPVDLAELDLKAVWGVLGLSPNDTLLFINGSPVHRADETGNVERRILPPRELALLLRDEAPLRLDFIRDGQRVLFEYHLAPAR